MAYGGCNKQTATASSDDSDGYFHLYCPKSLGFTCFFTCRCFQLLLGFGLGVLHLIINDHKVKLGLVPCDYVTNAVIGESFDTSRFSLVGLSTFHVIGL